MHHTMNVLDAPAFLDPLERDVLYGRPHSTHSGTPSSFLQISLISKTLMQQNHEQLHPGYNDTKGHCLCQKLIRCNQFSYWKLPCVQCAFETGSPGYHRFVKFCIIEFILTCLTSTNHSTPLLYTMLAKRYCAPQLALTPKLPICYKNVYSGNREIGYDKLQVVQTEFSNAWC